MGNIREQCPRAPRSRHLQVSRPEQHAALCRPVNSKKKLEQRCFAASRDPRQRHEVAPLDRPVHVLQNFLDSIIIFERNVVHHDLVKRVKHLTLFLCRQLRQLQQALRRRTHAVQLRSDAHRVRDGPLDPADQLQHRGERTVSQVPAIDVRAAPQHTEQPRKVKDQPHTVIHPEAEHSLPHLLLAQILLIGADPSLLPSLRQTRLHQLDIDKSLLHRRVQPALSLLHPLMPCLHRPAEQDHQSQSQRAARQHQNNKMPVHRDQDSRRADKTNHNSDQTRQNTHDAVLDHAHIREDPVHQLAAVIPLQSPVFLGQNLVHQHLLQRLLQLGRSVDPQPAAHI